ncbi:hypothetical protein HanXRQr2_Chr11g0478171 [Helianthus annuus]|uniref:Uncharacterized protein n=1 Tax=Helianthus annuus TaxID=4232 RepID=A0A9K3HM36_HELAN|nr:hypothetical protein HanXRQr2_Chr11g0478171 [Helianthus annuus]KAJ0874163.1 hypothetical protein HanPSC8_Chr11g0460891 [Helianthus annuus]
MCEWCVPVGYPHNGSCRYFFVPNSNIMVFGVRGAKETKFEGLLWRNDGFVISKGLGCRYGVCSMCTDR